MRLTFHCIDFGCNYPYNSGYGLVLQHFRQNEECGVLEELEPIDRNLKYDFDYQVFWEGGNKSARDRRIHPV